VSDIRIGNLFNTDRKPNTFSDWRDNVKYLEQKYFKTLCRNLFLDSVPTFPTLWLATHENI